MKAQPLRIASLFSAPSHALDDTLPRSRYEEARRELVHAEAFAHHHGLRLGDVASDAALKVAFDDRMRQWGLIP